MHMEVDRKFPLHIICLRLPLCSAAGVHNNRTQYEVSPFTATGILISFTMSLAYSNLNNIFPRIGNIDPVEY